MTLDHLVGAAISLVALLFVHFLTSPKEWRKQLVDRVDAVEKENEALEKQFIEKITRLMTRFDGMEDQLRGIKDELHRIADRLIHVRK